MRKKIFVFLLSVLAVFLLTACGKEAGVPPSGGQAIEIVDMSGRKVMVPGNINKVYATSPNGSILIYTLAPDKLIGLSGTPTGGAVKYISDQYSKLPVLGGGEGQTANRENIIQAKPDIIIAAMMADIDDAMIMANADRLQKQTGIPVVVIDGKFANTDKTYEFIGKLLNEQDRARELGYYFRETINNIGETVGKIPAEKLVRVYYAEGPSGLATDPAGSRHTEVLDFVRGINVAQVQTGLNSVPATVSLERVIYWKPDVIIANRNNAFDSWGGFRGYVGNNDDWKNLNAVNSGKIYEIPAAPFNWFDRPPSVARIIGIKWLANLLYPDFVKLDIKAATKEFYEKFYRYKLSDSEVDELLQNSMRK